MPLGRYGHNLFAETSQGPAPARPCGLPPGGSRARLDSASRRSNDRVQPDNLRRRLSASTSHRAAGGVPSPFEGHCRAENAGQAPLLRPVTKRTFPAPKPPGPLTALEAQGLAGGETSLTGQPPSPHPLGRRRTCPSQRRRLRPFLADACPHQPERWPSRFSSYF